jgi:hypothetical protein
MAPATSFSGGLVEAIVPVDAMARIENCPVAIKFRTNLAK